MIEQKNNSNKEASNIFDESAQKFAEIVVAFLDEQARTCKDHDIETKLSINKKLYERRNY